MSFLDINDPAKRTTLVKEYVTVMKTVKQRNMMNREMKLAIGDELQTLFHPIVNATKQAAEGTRRELESMKKPLRDNQKHAAEETAVLRFENASDENIDKTYSIFEGNDGQLQMGNKIVTLNENSTTLNTEDNEYDYTAGLQDLIWLSRGFYAIYQTDTRYRILKVLLYHTVRGNIDIFLELGMYLWERY